MPDNFQGFDKQRGFIHSASTDAPSYWFGKVSKERADGRPTLSFDENTHSGPETGPLLFLEVNHDVL